MIEYRTTELQKTCVKKSKYAHVFPFSTISLDRAVRYSLERIFDATEIKLSLLLCTKFFFLVNLVFSFPLW